MYEDILNLPEETGRLGTMVAISDLIHEAERLEAARAAKAAELLELRAQTAELFGSALEAAGNDEGTVSAAKAMWERDPQTAAQAIAGCSIEDAVSAAGCNQYKHKPGCPEADSTEDSEDRSWADKSNYTKLKSTIATAKKARERYNESPSQENSAFLSTATARVKKYAESLISENKKIFDRLNKEGMSKQDDYELGERRPYSVLIDGQRAYANFIGAANYLKNNANGERAEEALRDIETSAKELAALDAELTKILKSHNKNDDEAKATHEPTIEDLLVGDLVQAAGCNQYKHKPGCPEADENNPGEIKRNSGKRIVSRKIEKSFFFPTEDEARRFNIAKDTFLEELDPDGYLPETEYRNKKRYVVFGNLFIKNKESKGKMFTNLSDEDYRDLWNAENEVAGAYLDFNEQMTPENLEAILKREREYDKVRLKLEKKYLKD